MFDDLANGAQDIMRGVVELVYFMRGGVTYEEMMRRTPGERQLMNAFIEKHLAREGKRMYPNY